MIVPLASGLVTATTSCTEVDPPAARAPMFQVTTPAASVPPPVALTNDVFAGMVDRKSAVEGKRVDLGGRRIIKKKMLPALIGSGPSALLIARIGEELTVVVSST